MIPKMFTYYCPFDHEYNTMDIVLQWWCNHCEKYIDVEWEEITFPSNDKNFQLDDEGYDKGDMSALMGLL